MRPIDKVITAVKMCLPTEFEGRADFIYKLDEICESVNYKTVHLSWQRFFDLIDKDLGQPDTDWKRKIQDIVSTKIDYRTVLGE